MAKYLYFQDGHAGGKNPISYKGDFFADWLIQFDDLLSVAKKNKVDGIIDGGDILHSPEPSYRVLDEIADRVEKTGIPIHSLFGNHASLYHSVEHSQYTGLAHLQKRSNLFQYFHTLEDKGFQIQGVEYYHNIEEELQKNGIIISDKKDIWKVAVVHAFICPKPFRPDVMHVVCDNIISDCQLVLVAHYHAVWEKKVGKTQYVDIGCFGRRSISEHEIEPSCILLDTEKRSYTVIPLKSAKPGHEVFDLSKKEQIKEFEGQIDAFISDLKDISVQSLDLKGIIEHLGKENKIDRDIIDVLINKVQELEKIS